MLERLMNRAAMGYDLPAAVLGVVGFGGGIYDGHTWAKKNQDGFIWRPCLLGGLGAGIGALAGFYLPYTIVGIATIDAAMSWRKQSR